MTKDEILEMITINQVGLASYLSTLEKRLEALEKKQPVCDHPQDIICRLCK